MKEAAVSSLSSEWKEEEATSEERRKRLRQDTTVEGVGWRERFHSREEGGGGEDVVRVGDGDGLGAVGVEELGHPSSRRPRRSSRERRGLREGGGCSSGSSGCRRTLWDERRRKKRLIG